MRAKETVDGNRGVEDEREGEIKGDFPWGKGEKGERRGGTDGGIKGKREDNARKGREGRERGKKILKEWH